MSRAFHITLFCLWGLHLPYGPFTSQALAQGPTIQISSTSSSVVFGARVRLTATFLDAQGNIDSTKPIAWVSNDPEILRVDANGWVTGLGLGIGGIIAVSGNEAFGYTDLQVLPSRIEVTPASVEMGVGDQRRFQAVAYDAQQRPIPDTHFYWRVTGPNGYDTDVGSIDESGLFRAHTWGRVTIHAIIEYEAFVRFVNQVEERASVNVRSERQYELSRLLSSSDVVSAQRLRPTFGSGFTANDAGQIAFLASLDGMGTGPMLYDNGVLELLTSGGRSTPLPGGIIGFFRTPVVNGQGNVLTSVGGWERAAGLMLSTEQGSSYTVLEDTRFTSLSKVSDFETTKESFNDSGEMAFRAYYFVPGTDVEGTALLLQSGTTQRIIRTTNQTLAGLGEFQRFEDFGLDAGGTVHFLAGAEQGIGLYKGDGTAEPPRVLGTGDALAGSTVAWMWDLVVTPEGDVAFGAYVSDGSVQLVRIRQGATTTLAVEELFRVFSASNGGVIFAGNTGAGPGLYHWDGEIVESAVPGGQLQFLIATYGAITGVEDAVITPGGRIFVQLRTERNGMVLIESGPAPGVMIQAGDPLPMQSNLYLHPDALVPNTGNGTPQLLLSQPGSLFSASTAEPVARLVAGDRLPDGEMFQGACCAVANEPGDVYFHTSTAGIQRYANGQVETIVPNGMQRDGAILFPAERFAVNDRGDLVFTANTSGEAVRMYLLENGDLRLLAYRGEGPPPSAAANGAIAAWWDNNLALDNQGRVMALMATAEDRIGYSLYSNGGWGETALFGEAQLDGLTLALGTPPRAVGSRFYAIWSIAPDFVIAEYDNGSWRSMVNRNNALPPGESMQRYFTTHYDVNRDGDVAYVVIGGGVQFLAIRSDNQSHIVHSTRAIEDPDLLLREFGSLDLRDDGRIYFTGFGVLNDDFGLYRALPLGSKVSAFRPRSRAKIGR